MSVAPRSWRSGRECLGAAPHPDATPTRRGALWQSGGAVQGTWDPQSREQGDETCRQSSTAGSGRWCSGPLEEQPLFFLLPWLKPGGSCGRGQPAPAGSRWSAGKLHGLASALCPQGVGSPVPTQGREANGLAGAPEPSSELF